MRGAFRLGIVSGISIYIHWTFSFVIAYVILTSSGQTGGPGVLYNLILVLSVFFCVLLHEFGHAFAARRFGIGTRDITLLPIGGLARLERMPEEPKKEFVVAIAGPLVNVVIALGLWIGLWIKGFPITPEFLVENPELLMGSSGLGMLVQLLLINIMLTLFNIIPAFPMDGGRILRSLLGMKLKRETATRIAAVVGQIFAVGFVIFGFWLPNYFMVFIGVFVFFGAQSESQMVSTQVFLKKIRVGEAMKTELSMMSAASSIQDALDRILAGSPKDFLISDGFQVVGVLPRQRIFNAVKGNPGEMRVVDNMARDFKRVDVNDSLWDVFNWMQEKGLGMLPVYRENELAGVVSIENIKELMKVRRFSKKKQ